MALKTETSFAVSARRRLRVLASYRKNRIYELTAVAVCFGSAPVWTGTGGGCGWNSDKFFVALLARIAVIVVPVQVHTAEVAVKPWSSGDVHTATPKRSNANARPVTFCINTTQVVAYGSRSTAGV